MPGVGRRQKYPWDSWTDGAQWRVVHGVDYSLSTHNFQIRLHGHAKAHGLRVTTRSFTARADGQNTEGLTFTFTEDTR